FCTTLLPINDTAIIHVLTNAIVIQQYTDLTVRFVERTATSEGEMCFELVFVTFADGSPLDPYEIDSYFTGDKFTELLSQLAALGIANVTIVSNGPPPTSAPPRPPIEGWVIAIIVLIFFL
ncbi:hypothetical protein, partial [Salmonella sp. s51228]|uniref:hypothetical protein n=1 Tax=Salmonella sp. s51228 TaxID=3159652 RepID=UPI00397F16B5